jgi:hypothetical protein
MAPDSLLVYSVASTALVAAMSYQAFLSRRQFYPTVRGLLGRMPARVCGGRRAAFSSLRAQVIYLTSSKLSLLILGNQALVLTLLFGQLCKRLFFGRLRDAEIECATACPRDPLAHATAWRAARPGRAARDARRAQTERRRRCASAGRCTTAHGTPSPRLASR